MAEIKIAAKIDQKMHPNDAKAMRKTLLRNLREDMDADVTIIFQSKPVGFLNNYMDMGNMIWMDITITDDNFTLDELNWAVRVVRGETKDELVGVVFEDDGHIIGPVKIENIRNEVDEWK